MKTSDVKATVGRVVHVYCPELWVGPQPGIVVHESFQVQAEPERFLADVPAAQDGHDLNVVNVNVQVDGIHAGSAAQFFRESEHGSTFGAVPIYDALSERERHEVVRASPAVMTASGRQFSMWAEWPPFVPAGVSKAPVSPFRDGGPVTGTATPVPSANVPPSLRAPEPKPVAGKSEPVKTEAPVHVPADAATAAAVGDAEIESLGDASDETKAGESAAEATKPE